MSLLLYAIVGQTPAPVRGDGLDRGSLRSIPASGLRAVVSDHQGQLTATPATLWAYNRAVAALMADHDVLPARFGSRFDTEAGVRAMLIDRHAELRARLQRVRGAVELGVRASWTVAAEQAPIGPNAGTAYMLRRLERDQRARHIAARLEAELGELARASSSRLLPRPTTPVAASYLVEHEHIDEFRARVHELGGASKETELVCTGPWPPYSFVEAERA